VDCHRFAASLALRWQRGKDHGGNASLDSRTANDRAREHEAPVARRCRQENHDRFLLAIRACERFAPVRIRRDIVSTLDELP
jgi:hypothetical protein